MNLLIVDDQKIVVEGLVNGIKWDGIGFDLVYTAYNALDAKTILENHTIEVMLCDIEMPIESGVDLLAWIQKKKMETLCIFLTAHAEFSYAQNALKLGGYDYIVQPAPYEEIYNAVKKAVQEVKKREKSKELSQIAEVYQTQENSILSVILKQYLEGEDVAETYKNYEQIGKLPQRNAQGYLVLIKLLAWKSSEEWEDSLLCMTFYNIVKELFDNVGLNSILVQMSSVSYAVILENMINKEVSEEDIKRQLLFFNSVCNQYLKCEVAVYYKYMEQNKTMYQVWTSLIKMCEDNVSMKPGIYTNNNQNIRQYNYRLPHVHRWKELVINGNMKMVELEANNFLDNLAENGTLSSSVLLEFYQDFMQMIYTATAELNINVKDMFRKDEEVQLYNEGMNSIHVMKKLIHHIAQRSSYNEEVIGDDNIVDKTIEYIMKHLDEEIRRDDLAEHVHLNSDYLTKIFKKETGLTLKEFVIQQKMQEAQALIRSTNLPIGFISAKVGYSNFSHFSYTYKKVMGITPNEERK